MAESKQWEASKPRVISHDGKVIVTFYFDTGEMMAEVVLELSRARRIGQALLAAAAKASSEKEADGG